MNQLLTFVLGTLCLVLLSWRALRFPHSHGFYRFFAAEALLALIIVNAPAWGAFLKAVTLSALLLVAGATVFLIATALAEERENLAKFGAAYVAYSKSTKRFIPFVISFGA